ncbi:hypothetical protein [Streptomyces sp. NPDC046685]|uniref:RICIN domain-containing protein n=1 Tax=Streptomyces sp. NPDC046685 TaxID=3157202 RepID=UPI0033D03813
MLCELEHHDGYWVIRNEKNATLCLQPASEPAAGVLLVVQTCNGSEIQSWQLVNEQTDLSDAAGPTGWWSLRPTLNTKLAAAPPTLGGGFSEVRLYRATNSSDRLWHHETPGRSW